MARALIIQLARLGDLLQTVPAIAALKDEEPSLELDLLCPSSLASIGRMIPQLSRVLEWDGAQWQRQAQAAGPSLRPDQVAEAERQLRASTAERYDRAYVLNQHPRALLAGALLGEETIGPRFDLLEDHLTPWASYIRRVATTGISHRVHLADAFCGLCRVRPTGQAISIRQPEKALRADLAEIGGGEAPWTGLIVGAGDALRCVPIGMWQSWIARYVDMNAKGRVVLLGDKQECERAKQIQDGLPSSVLGRVWDLTGRTSLIELASVLGRCRFVVGADTGPLHLAAAIGTQVVGWYFARARVHETGPYGTGHVVWQAWGQVPFPALRVGPYPLGEGVGSRSEGLPTPRPMVPDPTITPSQWPIDATAAFIAGQAVPRPEGWTMWHSHCDRWGAYFTESEQDLMPPAERERTWHLLHPAHL
jgi:ADP-heptose:LPS heptosyltransferase